MMLIPKKVLGLSLVLLILAAAGYFLVLKKAPGGADQKTAAQAAGGAVTTTPAAPEAKTEAAPLPVKTAIAKRGNLVMTLKSPGEAYTERKIVLKSEVGGRIKNLYVQEGRHVKENDILVEIDDIEYRLNLERNEALRLKYLSELHLEKQFAVTEQAATPEALANLNKTQAAHDKALADFQAGKISTPELEKTQREYELALIDAGRKKDEIIATTKGLTGAEIGTWRRRSSGRPIPAS
jgi:multidrug efflux pump subunit AcrA (membrane-fusion protein)